MLGYPLPIQGGVELLLSTSGFFKLAVRASLMGIWLLCKVMKYFSVTLMYFLNLLFLFQTQMRGWAYVPESSFKKVNIFNVEVKESCTRSGRKK